MIIALSSPPPLAHEGAAFIFTVLHQLFTQQVHKKVDSSCVYFMIQICGETNDTCGYPSSGIMSQLSCSNCNRFL